MDKCSVFFRLDLMNAFKGERHIINQNHLGAVCLAGGNADRAGSFRHHHFSGCTYQAGGKSNRNGMVARADGR